MGVNNLGSLDGDGIHAEKGLVAGFPVSSPHSQRMIAFAVVDRGEDC